MWDPLKVIGVMAFHGALVLEEYECAIKRGAPQNIKDTLGFNYKK